MLYMCIHTHTHLITSVSLDNLDLKNKAVAIILVRQTGG